MKEESKEREKDGREIEEGEYRMRRKREEKKQGGWM